MRLTTPRDTAASRQCTECRCCESDPPGPECCRGVSRGHRTLDSFESPLVFRLYSGRCLWPAIHLWEVGALMAWRERSVTSKELSTEAEATLGRFFAELEEAVVPVRAQMAAERRALPDRLRGFFAGLAPAIQVAETTQERIDRRLATRFSVFDDFFHFIHKKENTLSRIFRSLLDPQGRHGQGSRFLDALLEEVSNSVRDSEPPRTNLASCRVRTEYGITKTTKDSRGSIDIVVDWPESGYWIGIENKPWAGEQDDQVQNYVEALLRETQQDLKRVLFLYFSGSGEVSTTLPDDEAKAARCITMPYHSESGQCSVLGWLRRCRIRCEADRIRWFLMEIEDYIQRSFHQASVSTDPQEEDDDAEHPARDGD